MVLIHFKVRTEQRALGSFTQSTWILFFARPQTFCVDYPFNNIVKTLFRYK